MLSSIQLTICTTHTLIADCCVRQMLNREFIQGEVNFRVWDPKVMLCVSVSRSLSVSSSNWKWEMEMGRISGARPAGRWGGDFQSWDFISRGLLAPPHLFLSPSTCPQVHNTCPHVHKFTCPQVHKSTFPQVHMSTCPLLHYSIVSYFNPFPPQCVVHTHFVSLLCFAVVLWTTACGITLLSCPLHYVYIVQYYFRWVVKARTYLKK